MLPEVLAPCHVALATFTKPMSSASNPSWTHRLARPVVRPLLNTKVRPNHLTTLRLVSGMAACLCFAIGTPAGTWWGGWLWLLSAFLDRADGEFARLGNMMSAAGHRYDYHSDVAVNSLVFASLGIGLLGSWSIPIGLIASLSMLFCLLVSEWLLQRSPTGTRAYTGRWGFDPDDALYLIAPMAWLGLQGFIVIGTAVCAPVMTLIISIRLLRMRRAAAAAAAVSCGGQW